MTIDEVTALMRWNVAMYSNSAKPLTDENAATQIAIWSFPHMPGRKLCRKRSLSAAFRSRWQTCATSCEQSKHSMKFLPQTLGFASTR